MCSFHRIIFRMNVEESILFRLDAPTVCISFDLKTIFPQQLTRSISRALSTTALKESNIGYSVSVDTGNHTVKYLMRTLLSCHYIMKMVVLSLGNLTVVLLLCLSINSFHLMREKQTPQ